MTQILPEPVQFGRYTLHERIGRGGMAEVFKGRIQGPAGFERVFVVKRILPPLTDDPTFIKMLIQEAKLSARLIHPNIVQIFELGAVDNEYFISMEHVPGHDLGETMRAAWRQMGAPAPEMVAYIGREMCRALYYAHSLTDDTGNPLGMIHRDVSPPNVMLSYEGGVKLLDFGIAKALGEAPEITQNGTIKGKYAYMAPEQTHPGAEVDHRIDIFAAGVVMHEVLTGRRLFKGSNDIETVERVRRCEVMPPSEVNPLCSPELDAIVLGALARDRDQRFATAGEMADALDDVVHASRFTPQHLAAILREVFGGEPGASPSVERRSMGSSSISRSPSSNRTIPPIAVSSVRPSSSTSPTVPLQPAKTDARSRPLWKRGVAWMAAAACAAAISVGFIKVAGLGQRSGTAVIAPGQPDPSSAIVAVAAAAPEPPPLEKPRRAQVLIQSEPQGAQVFLADRATPEGATPVRLELDVDRDNPPRLTLRKAGYREHALALNDNVPAVVRLVPVVEEPVPPSASTGQLAPLAGGLERSERASPWTGTGTGGGIATRRSGAAGSRRRTEIVDPFIVDPTVVDPFDPRRARGRQR